MNTITYPTFPRTYNVEITPRVSTHHTGRGRYISKQKKKEVRVIRTDWLKTLLRLNQK